MDSKLIRHPVVIACAAFVALMAAALGLAQETTRPVAPKKTTNSVGMTFIKIPKGSFLMGTPSTEPDRDEDEGPRRLVTIKSPFWISVTEVTQEQWTRVMGKNPSFFRHPDNPVDTVSWRDCQRFIKRLNRLENTGAYRLPTEAEWEYAARAGTTTAYYFGDDPRLLDEYAWYDENSDGKAHQVKLKPPNPHGLYDMLGNLWEWCQDYYGEDYYKKGPAVDPKGPKDGENRVMRGGSWFSFASYLRCGYRHSAHPNDTDHHFGFRVVSSERPETK